MLFTRNDLQSKIIKELSAFLDALPSQVGAWDQKVVSHLASNPETLQQFQAGSAYRKWDIYAGIRYR